MSIYIIRSAPLGDSEPLKILKFNFVQLSTGKYFLPKIAKKL